MGLELSNLLMEIVIKVNMWLENLKVRVNICGKMARIMLGNSKMG
jgi:hypothetical protein